MDAIRCRNFVPQVGEGHVDAPFRQLPDNFCTPTFRCRPDQRHAPLKVDHPSISPHRFSADVFAAMTSFNTAEACAESMAGMSPLTMQAWTRQVKWRRNW